MKVLTSALAVFLLTACNIHLGPVNLTIGDTPTPVSSSTPMPTATPKATPVPLKVGIDTPVIVMGVDLKFTSAVEIKNYTLSDGTVISPNPGWAMWDVFAQTRNGNGYTIPTWPKDAAGDAVLVVASDEFEYVWSMHNSPLVSLGDRGMVDWIFLIPVGTRIAEIHLPGGVEVDLSSLTFPPSGGA